MLKISLISTVFNEALNIEEYLASIAALRRLPDELVVVDAGSSDGTWELLQKFAASSPFPVRLACEKGCNIARGRNIAIGLAAHDIIAVSDAGCTLDPDWLGEITRPFSGPDADVVGGWYEPDARNAFEKAAALCTFGRLSLVNAGNFLPSSRSIAFTRRAWASVGGYPEWLTLTAEDTLFDLNLKWGGCRFAFAPGAVVRWRPRKDLAGLLRQYFLYGFGDGEARLPGEYLKITVRLLWLTVLVPAAFLLHPLAGLAALAFLLSRYCKRLNSLRSLQVPQALALAIMLDATRLCGWGKGLLVKKSGTNQ